MATSCTACDTCCPEAADVTVNNNTYALSGAAVDITVADVSPVDATKQQITLQMQDADGVNIAGNYNIQCWFVDTPQADAAKSLTPPTDPGVAEFVKVTDATGENQFNVENPGALDTWYLCCEVAGGVAISAAITIGV